MGDGDSVADRVDVLVERRLQERSRKFQATSSRRSPVGSLSASSSTLAATLATFTPANDDDEKTLRLGLRLTEVIGETARGRTRSRLQGPN